MYLRGITPLFVFVIAVVCLVFLSSAFHMYYLAQSQNFIQRFMNDSLYQNYNVSFTRSELKLAFGLLNAAHYITGFAGIALANWTIDRLGRRPLLFRINVVIDIATSVLMFSAVPANRFELLFIGRAVYGVQWGSHMVVLSTYLTEVSPPKIRGAASAFTMTVADVWTFMVFCLGLPSVLGTYELFHYQFIITLLPASLVFICSFFLPESPKFTFINRANPEKASVIIKKLYGNNEKAAEAMKSFASERDQADKRIALSTILRDPTLRTTLLLATCLAMARMTSGAVLMKTYAFIMYTEELGMTPATATYIHAVMQAVMIGCSALGIWLIDRAGRRPLTLFGLFGSSGFAILYVITTKLYESFDSTSLVYLSIASILIINCIYHACLNVVTYYTVGEITTQVARATTTVATMTVSTCLRILYCFVFPILQTAAGVYTLIILVVIPSTAIAIYLAIELPETRRRTADDVVNQIIRKKSSNALTLSVVAEESNVLLTKCV